MLCRAPPHVVQVIDDKESSRRAEDAKARNEPHFYMMEMAPGGRARQLGGGTAASWQPTTPTPASCDKRTMQMRS